ncbi:MAG: tagaturonate reductase [Candidatus Pedobacter colombiensis]|uniref:Tagaturonate reductase n=1 Tax=Candidatus Pedobacter colombiensis TaxID=3121371 RepID=A0AAJ5WAX2_9SPHI|nr:tagaturonate reductase [Pedobacter sp.]WEK20291.1 MAG: tagaturonate reductase [Pedobacter sp.]
MNLSKNTLADINAVGLILPKEELFNLPEKVLQFGTGVLLRGLPDYFIDKANRNGLFNGRVAVVKSTSKGGTKEFDEQDSLYTICVRGIENGQPVEENIISSAISRVLTADQDWNTILEIASSPELNIIVSNTTEVGIQLVKESIAQKPPVSFPAKLLAVLYARYKALGNTEVADLAVIATELISDNGKKLEAIVLELVAFNELDAAFTAWLSTHIRFCNSLVDRIVPGKPDAAALAKLETALGYTDELIIMAEPYRLWAIEGDEKVSALLGLEAADQGVIVRPDIEIFKELKVRLLNGSHTLTSGIAYLSGIDTVTKAMNNEATRNYVKELMMQEIVGAIPYDVAEAEAVAFANTVIDRFANPNIEHLWINITFQYTMKMKIRVLPVLLNYYKINNKVPAHIALGFAAFLLFMKAARKEGNQYFGNYEGREYLITDDEASYFYEAAQQSDADYVNLVLANNGLWGTDLSALDGFNSTVKENYNNILKNGVANALAGIDQSLQVSK